MGCGHSKINIYPKRSRNKNNNKKTVTQDKDESEEEEPVENEVDETEDIDEADRKTIKIKQLGGPLLAQKELSTSQQNFFKMLDEKIENGPDYDSSSEAEKAAETTRLTALLKDWETASAGSRSLPATPKKSWRTNEKFAAIRNAEIRAAQQQRAYQQPINQSAVHQSYGINHHPVYNPHPTYHSPPHQSHAPHQPLGYPYQTLGPVVGPQQTYQHPQQPQRLYNSPRQAQNIPHNPTPYGANANNPYSAIPNHVYSNGELIQQQVYSQQLQYQQAREYQQYRQAREQQLLIQHRNYQQSNVHVPYNQASESPILHRSHYEMA